MLNGNEKKVTDMLETQINGLTELQKILDQLPVKVEKKILRGALRAGQKVVLDQAKASIHNVSGALADSLRISTRTGKDGKISVRVVAGNKTAYYAHMVEFGTAKHLIKPKSSKSSKSRKSLLIAGMMREVVHHPGAKKKPFMRPAADAAATDASEAITAFKDYMATRITKEMDKLPDESNGVTK